MSAVCFLEHRVAVWRYMYTILHFFVLGVESLIRKKVYTGAFPLHEVGLYVLYWQSTSAFKTILIPAFACLHIFHKVVWQHVYSLEGSNNTGEIYC